MEHYGRRTLNIDGTWKRKQRALHSEVIILAIANPDEDAGEDAGEDAVARCRRVTHPRVRRREQSPAG